MAVASRRVLVTRPEPGASMTARRLQELGFAPIKLPLQEIRRLPDNTQAIPDEVAAVAVTSANAIRHAPLGTIERLLDLPCFAIGATTAGTMRAAGFSNVVEGNGDSEALAEIIIAHRPAGPMVYLCGRVRSPRFELRLNEATVAVVPVETYDAARVVRSSDQIVDAIGTAPVGHVLIYSAFAADAMVEVMTRPKLSYMFKTTEFLCISARAASVLNGVFHGNILVAGEPNETSLLSLLGSSGGHTP
jgi:uroporphyrinogen-III synthase